MDNDKIVKLFRDEAEPGLSDMAKQRIIGAAVTEFERSRPARVSFMRPLAGLAIAAAVTCLLAVAIWPTAPAPMSDAERQKAVLAEFNQVFGQRLQAVVNEDGKTEIILADKDQPRGQPLHIHLSGEGHSVDVTSFSGQNLTLTINGRQINFDALVDAKGGIILSGEKLFWHGGDAPAVDGLKVKAQPLEM